MAMTRAVATVFGGSGFLGRYVVKRLAALGYVVRVAVRDPESASFLKPMGQVAQVVPLYAPVENEADAMRAVADASIVVNLVGILAERRRGDFRRVHAEGAGRVARLATAAGARHLIHVSAIGADPNGQSLYARSKGEGEQAVRDAFPGAVILRPSIVFGPEDRFFNRFARLATISPVLPIVGGRTKFQPVYVSDVAQAVIAACAEGAGGKVFELGGPEIRSFAELMRFMLSVIGRHRLIWDMPFPIARLSSFFLQHLPGKMLTADQLALLRCDNIVAKGALDLSSLNITPTPMDLVVPHYLSARPGGRRWAIIR
jgi:NADH dehydrogenase